MNKLGILKWEDYPGLFQWAQCNKGSYKREAEITVREGGVMMSRGWSDESISQGVGAVSRRCNRIRNRFSPQDSKSNQLCQCPDFSPKTHLGLLTFRTVRK